MKSKFYFFTRVFISIGLLAGLIFYISPVNFVDTITTLDKKWLFWATTLMPLFLYCRMTKWYLLLCQLVEVKFLDIIPSYLKGMALGMLTPVRSGEVFRIIDSGDKTSQIYLFIVEKIIEVICLCALIVFPVSKLDIPGFIIAIVTVTILIFMMIGLRIVKKLSFIIIQRFLKHKLLHATGLLLKLDQLKISGCTSLSFVCFFIFMFQVYFIMRGFGCDVSINIICFFPFILISNLLPVTIGGLGLREGMAVLILSSQKVPDTVSMGSFFIVTVIDLFIPAVVGLFFFVFHKRFHTGSKNKKNSTHNVNTQEWNEFWENRKKKPLGRLINFIRKRFVTPILANYVKKNTPPGTLIEAGCGTAEVSIKVGEERGDKIILVDISDEALKRAEFNALRAGIPVKVIKSDITCLYESIGRIDDGTVFNIGVIEHFEDCTPILHQMAAVSGQMALAVVPERSIFWRIFISISFFLNLVPDDFYIHLFTVEELKNIVEKEGLTVIGISSVKIFGIIPYTGISFFRYTKKEG